MNGIELAKELYNNKISNLIHNQLSEYENRIAVGLVGHGSECFGFDDETSKDHDFDAGLCLWLTDEDDILFGIKLSRLYKNAIPPSSSKHSLFGNNRHGVQTIGSFYLPYTGRRGAPLTWQDWLYTPSYALAEASNGIVFRDDLGEFSKIRCTILNGMPEDVRRKKIAAKLVTMAQTGQYNYSRCLKHSEPAAAAIALSEFVKASVELAFLLRKSHMPYYKWMFRKMGELEGMEKIQNNLEHLLASRDDYHSNLLLIEETCSLFIKELKLQSLSTASDNYLEPHAVSVMSTIGNHEIASLHIMEG